MDRARFIEHKGKRILVSDFSNCTTEEVVAVTEAGTKLVLQSPPNSILALANVTGARFDKKAVQAVKQYAAQNKPYVRASAVVGASGLKEVILHGVIVFTRRKISSFNDVESALDWLAAN